MLRSKLVFHVFHQVLTASKEMLQVKVVGLSEICISYVHLQCDEPFLRKLIKFELSFVKAGINWSSTKLF
jgi:hypothetical protein